MKALNEFVFLRENKTESETSGGILLAGQEKFEGVVYDGVDLKKGTVVRFAPHAPRTEVLIDDTVYLVIEKKFLLCTL